MQISISSCGCQEDGARLYSCAQWQDKEQWRVVESLFLQKNSRDTHTFLFCVEKKTFQPQEIHLYDNDFIQE